MSREENMGKYFKIKSGLFIPQEILKSANINGEDIEIEIGEREISIHPVGGTY